MNDELRAYFAQVSITLDDLPLERVAEAIATLDDARIRRRRVYVFGNGGSAATASHFTCDLAKGAIGSRKPRIRVQCLVDNTSVFSAWANDTSYDRVFAEQLEDTIEAGDVAIAISGSGNSPNVLQAVRVAARHGATTIGLCGFDGGKLAHMADIPIVVPSHRMEQVEDIHLMLAHAMAVGLRNLDTNTIVITREPAELVKAAQPFMGVGKANF